MIHLIYLLILNKLDYNLIIIDKTYDLNQIMIQYLINYNITNIPKKTQNKDYIYKSIKINFNIFTNNIKNISEKLKNY